MFKAIASTAEVNKAGKNNSGFLAAWCTVWEFYVTLPPLGPACIRTTP
jgi:hypothetical protein